MCIRDSYEYQPSRKSEHAAKFLEGFSGYLHADGYQGYHKLPEDIRVVGCWAHARRKFDEALNALPTDKREGTAALTGLDYCNKLFAWEKQFKDLSPEERTKQRLKEENPILDALLAWANSVPAAPKSACIYRSEPAICTEIFRQVAGKNLPLRRRKLPLAMSTRQRRASALLDYLKALSYKAVQAAAGEAKPVP